MAFVLAHQGGWDETLVVLGPLALLALVLWIATKRAGELPPDPSPDDGEPEDVVHGGRDG